MATEDENVDVTAQQDRVETSQDRQTATVAGGLDENVAGALCYFLGFITGLLFYLVEENNDFVRFHAAQSIIVFGGLLVASFAFGILQVVVEFIPFVGWIFGLAFGLIWLLISPIAFVLWIVLMYKAYKGERYALPVVGNIAEEHV